MTAFIWDERFETGLALVDEQHRGLVDLTNQLGDLLLAGGEMDETRLQALFQQLAVYGRQHFADEERLMVEYGLAPAHLQTHATRHREFVEQLVQLWRSRSTLQRPGETIHGFLSSWLTIHILGEDQAMARQIRRIQAKLSPEAAYAAEKKDGPPGNTAILLEALQRLYALLAEQNANLAQANQTLEEKVAQRTRDLSAALHRAETTQQQLLQSEKMAAIGQLAAGVAHEINNPVGFVNSNLRTLGQYMERLLNLVNAYESQLPERIAEARRLADLDFLREDLPSLMQESVDGLGRVTRIVQDLKDFSHVDQSERQLADLNRALESTLNVVWNELKYKAEIVRELQPLPEIPCYPAQINQVFMNLLINAAHAIPQHGHITLRSGATAETVWFEIEDTGTGMPAEVQKRIFEPFFTTKPVGQGTGLGLSISYDIIVKKHGGQLSVRSREGAGSCFRIELPRQAADDPT